MAMTSADVARQTYPLIDALRAEVITDYEPQGEFSSSQLRLSKGDFVWVLEQHESGWWGGHKEGDDLTGWFPATLVRAVGMDEDDSRCSPEASPRTDPTRTRDQQPVASPQARGGRRRSALLTIENMPGNADRSQESAAMIAALEEQVKQLQSEKQSMELERQQLANDAAKEAQRHKDEIQQKEAELAEFRTSSAGRFKELEANIDELRSRCKDLEEAKDKAERLVDALQRAAEAKPAASFHQDDMCLGHSRSAAGNGCVRAPSAGTPGSSRRPPPALSQDTITISTGTRTPPPTISTSVSHQMTSMPAAVTTSAPAMPTLAAVPTISVAPPTPVGTTAGTPLSARHATHAHSVSVQPPRPTPRGATPHAPWSPAVHGGAATVGVPASPGAWLSDERNRHRPLARAGQGGSGCAPPGSALREESNSKPIEVRALVSAFERRSNSQGAPPSHRGVDPPPPSRQLLYTASATAPSGCLAGRSQTTLGSSSRAASASREALSVHVLQTPESSLHSTQQLGMNAYGEDVGLNFGMSPIQRQVHHQPFTSGTPQTTTRHVSSSPSPNSKGSVSVQDRIAALNRGANGMFSRR